jgi:biopolymer transport protein ExbD
MERLDLVLLALLLVRVGFVAVRASRRCRGARRTGPIDTASETFQSARRKLVAELRIEVGNLKSIALMAPYIGLAGTTLGILDLLSEGFVGSRSSIVVWLSLGISAAFLATAGALLVAILAVVCRNFLHMRIDSLAIDVHSKTIECESGESQFAQSLPLTKRFSGLPSFALIAAPVLALSAAFMSLSSFYPRQGLPVIPAKTVSEMDYVSPKPIQIVITVRNRNGLPIAYVNSKETPWEQLGPVVQKGLLSPQALVFVQAENDSSWKHVVDAVDIVEGLHARVVLLTTASPGASPPTGIRK